MLHLKYVMLLMISLFLVSIRKVQIAVHLSVFPSVCLSVCLSVCVCLCLSVPPSIPLSIFPSAGQLGQLTKVVLKYIYIGLKRMYSVIYSKERKFLLKYLIKSSSLINLSLVYRLSLTLNYYFFLKTDSHNLSGRFVAFETNHSHLWICNLVSILMTNTAYD